MQAKTQALSVQRVQALQREDAKTMRLSAVEQLPFDGVSGVSLTREPANSPAGREAQSIIIASEYYVEYARSLKS